MKMYEKFFNPENSASMRIQSRDFGIGKMAGIWDPGIAIHTINCSVARRKQFVIKLNKNPNTYPNPSANGNLIPNPILTILNPNYMPPS